MPTNTFLNKIFLSFSGLILLINFYSCKKDLSLQPIKEAIKYYNVQYGADSKQQMDIALPKDRNNNTPVIFFIHGGGWISGDKGDMAVLEPVFLEKGFAVVSINYRYADSTHNYNHLNSDIATAVSFFTTKASEYYVSNNKLAMLGYSAGAQLALLYSYQNQSIKAVVSISAPSNFNNLFY